MKRQFIAGFFLCTLLVFVSCGKNLGSGSLKPDEVVLDADKGMDWVFGKGYSNWAPEDKDIQTAEKLLQDCFDKQKMGTVNRLLDRKPDDYDKQFVGATDASGDKIIWVNCFCKKEESVFKNWKNSIIHVADGGNCFFHVKINITKNTFLDLMVNGNA